MTLHDLRDIVDIYYSDKDGKTDYTWDKSAIKVWNPNEQREMEIYFTGSTRPGVLSKDDAGEINFNARYVDNVGDNGVLKAFNKVMDGIIDSRFDMSIDWESRFLQYIVEYRHNTKK